jgi:hypothetical protein
LGGLLDRVGKQFTVWVPGGNRVDASLMRAGFGAGAIFDFNRVAGKMEMASCPRSHCF